VGAVLELVVLGVWEDVFVGVMVVGEFYRVVAMVEVSRNLS